MKYIVKTTSLLNSSKWKNSHSKKALVLMSGGVDSSAAALLLMKENYSLAGMTMEITESEEALATESAASVCKELSIPHFSVNISEDFKKNVILPFCNSYSQGLTPNPCADCNERIKFGVLWEAAEELFGNDFSVATGHYARIIKKDDRHYLAAGANKAKDQSYFLSGIPAKKMQRILFPLGDFKSKEETRELVRTSGLAVSERPESMEICFANEDGYRAIICRDQQPGPITDTSGKVLGEHKGIGGYTLGQRKGLGIASKHPLFVISIVPETNTVVVASRAEAFRSEVTAGSVNILAPDYLREGLPLLGKIRSQGDPMPCRVLSVDHACLTVRFSEPIFAPAPGQRLVIYTDEGYVAAGGVIKISP
ncbi:MAG: tRNA-specific 2-thiouridylase MnmA [Synergistaceae bacterium]|nr:tRNA 2-thiouridine(34) synthase MnmA [Synergistaceae bacterium]